MKKTILAAVLTALVTTVGSYAQVIGTNDVLLAFKTSAGTGAGIDAIIDLGNFTTQTSYTLDQSGAASLLSSTYGTSWFTRTDLFWGVVGANTAGAGSDIWATRSLTSGIYTSPSTLGTVASNVNNMIGAFTGGTGTTNSITTGITGGPASLLGATTAATTANSFTIQDKLPNFFGGLGGTVSLANFNNTIRAVYDYNNFTSKLTGNTIQINNAGLITVTTLAAVPEPGTYALLGLGMVILLVGYRKRFNKEIKNS